MLSNDLNVLVDTSLIRGRWTPTEYAVKDIVAFERRFGIKHLRLACHAALPLIVSPELLNLIHINFLDGEEIPWIAEADFLLSRLCRPLDDGLYEVEPGAREVLLVELKNQFGSRRPLELANFLRAHSNENPDWTSRQNVIQTHQWIAGAYIEPNSVIDEMKSILERSISTDEDTSIGLASQIHVANMLEIALEPLELGDRHTDLQQLVNDSRMLAHGLYGDKRDLQDRIFGDISDPRTSDMETELISPVLWDWLEKNCFRSKRRSNRQRKRLSGLRDSSHPRSGGRYGTH